MAQRKKNEIKKLSGSRHVKISQPLAPVSTEHPPRGWTIPPARAIFNKLAPYLRDSGYLREVDVPTALAWCEAIYFRMEAAQTLHEEGQIVEGAIATKKNPSWQQWRDSTMVMVRLSKELGATPRAIQSMDPVAGSNDDDLITALFASIAGDMDDG